jgi:alpha-1,2-mannosyltransferase
MLMLPTLRRGRGRGRRVVLAALAAVIFSASMLTYQHGALNLGVYRFDLNVYRVGAQAWMHGRALYGTLPPIANGMLEPFTYPPISAVLMTPFALVSNTVAGVLMTAVSLSLLICVLALFLRAAKLATGPGSWKIAVAVLPLAVLIEPVRSTLALGQINIVLMALVSFDLLLPSTRFTVAGRTVGWPRGALTGIAAAIKLTPLVFLLYFLARRDRRGALSLAGSFLVVTALGFALGPADSRSYWTSTVFDTSRIGAPYFSANQSLAGVLTRAHLTGPTETAAWLAASAIVAATAFLAIRRAARNNETVTAVALTACAELLISPVSWSHHWVWVAPLLVCALLEGWRRRRTTGPRYLIVAALVTAVFLAAPQIWFPHSDNRELGWGWWEQIIGSAYVWVAITALALCALRRRGPGPATRGPEPDGHAIDGVEPSSVDAAVRLPVRRDSAREVPMNPRTRVRPCSNASAEGMRQP